MKKNILIDIYKINDLYSGLGQFSFHFAHEIMSQIPDEYQIHFLCPKTSLTFNSKAKIIQANWIKRYVPNSNPTYDIWHSMHQFPSHFPNQKTKQILTIHDLNFLEEKTESKIKKYLKKLQQNVNKADVLVCISEFTKNILSQHINIGNKPIHIIYNGVKLNAFPKPQELPFGVKNKFFFSISVFKEQKNFEAIIYMMPQFPKHKLVIAGNHDTNYGNKIKQLIKKLNLEQQIILPGKISDADRYHLYQNCEAFLFPSKAEGFGIPPIEAMISGKPVFLSNYSSLPEIGGQAAFYFDSFNKKDMAQVIQNGLQQYHSNSASMSKFIQEHAHRYQWKNCIHNYLQLYSDQ